MKPSRWLILGLWILGVTLPEAFAQDRIGTEFFEARIRPILVKQCYSCHSGEAARRDKLKGGLLLDTRDGLRRGGDSGPAIVPGSPEKSLLLAALKHEDLEMPPKGRLPAQVINDFTAWIKMGAPDPRDGKGVVRQTIDLEQGRRFWCFQQIEKPEPPVVNDESWPISAVDQFIAARWERQGLRPARQATPETLVRRLSFDLTGLPPHPEVLEQWTRRLSTSDAAARSRGLEELVDSLLDSPQFGERWGRHWLDVARYAESNGNSRNATFPHAWRYRDYVIDAVNADTPYDQFVLEQLAGDLLPHDSVELRNRQLVATGFLALGSKPVIRGKQAGFVPDIVADQIEVTSRAVLGLTVACARCHDHKFDPIPTADYYGLAGIFASSRTLYGGGGKSMGGAPATPLHTLTNKDPSLQQAFVEWQKEVATANDQLKQVNNRIKKLRPRKKNRKKKGGKSSGSTPEQKQELQKLEKQRGALTAALKELRNNPVAAPAQAMGIREAGKVMEVAVYVRGESPKGQPIPRRLLSVATQNAASFPADQSGRLELARWLTSPENPLTARVMVNRVWLHLFGEGIVRTPDNFGVNGERPTHPQMLDWLAAGFVSDDWSLKRLIKRIVLTRTYQLSAQHLAKNYDVDPDNLYFWRHAPRRLEAEAIRDAILAASGQLELQRPQGSVVTVHQGKLIQDALTPDKIHQPSKHRSVYLPILRNGLPEVLQVFDVADPSLVVGRRTVTTVPAQDLFLMNSPFVVENSQSFANQLMASSQDGDARIEQAYRRALSRNSTQQELERARQFLAQAQESLAPDTADRERLVWTSFCQALFVSAEFRHIQ